MNDLNRRHVSLSDLFLHELPPSPSLIFPACTSKQSPHFAWDIELFPHLLFIWDTAECMQQILPIFSNFFLCLKIVQSKKCPREKDGREKEKKTWRMVLMAPRSRVENVSNQLKNFKPWKTCVLPLISKSHMHPF